MVPAVRTANGQESRLTQLSSKMMRIELWKLKNLWDQMNLSWIASWILFLSKGTKAEPGQSNLPALKPKLQIKGSLNLLKSLKKMKEIIPKNPFSKSLVFLEAKNRCTVKNHWRKVRKKSFLKWDKKAQGCLSSAKESLISRKMTSMVRVLNLYTLLRMLWERINPTKHLEEISGIASITVMSTISWTTSSSFFTSHSLFKVKNKSREPLLNPS